MVRELACFCCFCMEKQWYACLCVQWTKDWRPETLKPKDTHFVQFIMEEEDINWDYGDDGNALATYLEIGDNFDINATIDNDEGQDSWFIGVQSLFIKLIKISLMHGVHHMRLVTMELQVFIIKSGAHLNLLMFYWRHLKLYLPIPICYELSNSQCSQSTIVWVVMIMYMNCLLML